MKIGVLAFQGSVQEHMRALERCGAEPVPVRKPEDLAQVQGLILPGGESTTLGRLMRLYGLHEAVQQRAAQGMPVYGTCAGMILLAREVEGAERPHLALMDIAVSRNAFGRQVESFEEDLPVPALGQEPLRAVFIRAPRVRSVGPQAEVLGRLGDEPVLVRQGTLLASSFHPELTDDLRLHRYFLDMVRQAEQGAGNR